MATDVTDATFEQEVIQSGEPVLVDFWAEWCGPCRQVAPILDEIGRENADKLEIVKLNIDENQITARDYRVMSIPTMIVFKGGEVVKTIVGAKPKAALLRDLAETWVEDWAGAGVAEIEEFLSKHAAFLTFLDTQES